MTILNSAVATRLSAALDAGLPELFDVLNDLFLSFAGIRTVTWLAARPDQRITERVGTSDPHSFPIGGSDPIDDAAWSRRIYGDRLPIVANTPDEMSFYIPETADLVAMGYHSIVCAPIIVGGQSLGTVNLIGEEPGLFAPDLLDRINALLPIAALVFTFDEVRAR
jgi:GAF domain-containing protein